ncbi:beta strand repeat-containing protein [Pantoea deleyi]|uniref:beta strand repeat-containing protein n=1 Tax=Pantoea deleyi TaxID=470932 RepID=UPI0035D4DA5C
MKIQLLVKDSNGNIIAKQNLQPGQPLTLQASPQAASYEVHSDDGQPPHKIVASNAHGDLDVKLVDDVTGEQFDVVIQNVSPEEMPVITASGPDGAIYAYDYDAANGVYELASGTASNSVADNVHIAAGVVGGLAGLVGVAAATNSGSKSSSRNRRAPAANEDHNTATTAPDTTPSISDATGNPVTDGSTTQSTPTISGSGMKPGSTVAILDGETVIGETTADANGHWSFTPDNSLSDGKHTLVVNGTDSTGKPASNSVDVTVSSADNTSTVPDNSGNNAGSGNGDNAGSNAGSGNGENSSSNAGTGNGDNSGSNTGTGSGNGDSNGSNAGSGNGDSSSSNTGPGNGGSNTGTGNGDNSGSNGDNSGSNTGSGNGDNSGSNTGSGNGGSNGSNAGTGNGDNSGSNTGTGNGSNTGSGNGDSNGSNAGSGTGNGTGNGDSNGSGNAGSGNGDNSGSNTGSGNGSSNGSNAGTGNGDNSGSNTGTGNGSNTGSDNGSSNGNGNGDNSGSNTGSGNGDSNGSNAGSGTGNGTGNGDNSGSNTGSGNGDSNGSNTGTGNGGSNGSNTGSGNGDNSGSNAGSGTGNGTDNGDSSGSNAGSGNGDSNGSNAGSGNGDSNGSNTGSGSSDNSGSNTGSGNGDSNGSNTGSGNGSSNGSNAGSGTGDSNGSNAGSGTGNGNGDSNGDSNGSGNAGSGNGDNSGSSNGSNAGTGSGNGDNSGSNTGNGDSSGSNTGSGNGDSNGSNTGTGNGDSNGSNTGNGDSSGSNTGSGNGDSNGSNTGTGTGSGNGDNSGSNTGSGNGDNSGSNTGSGNGSSNGSNAGTGNGDNSGSNTGTGNGSNAGSGNGDNSGSNTGTGNGSNAGSGSNTDSGNGDNSGSNTGSGNGDSSGSNTGSGNGGSNAGSGNGDNSGSNAGSGNGDSSGSNTGSGDGDNSGSNAGTGSGNGDNSGSNTGSGNGDNSGSNAGSGNGDSNGSNTGSGNGDSSGSNTGSGNGDSNGSNTGSGNGDNSGSNTGSGNGGSNAGTGNGDNSGSNTGTGDGDNSGSNTGTGDGDSNGSNTGSGDGDNSGSNTGTGDGDSNGSNTGSGNGDNSGSNAGTGNGDNSGSNTGSGDGDSNGSNTGSGNGDNSGSNTGSGDGDSSGSNSGTGDGDGDSNGSNTGTGSGDGDSNGSNTGSGDGDNSGSNAGTDTDNNAGSNTDDEDNGKTFAPTMEIVDDNGTAIADGTTTRDSTPTFIGKGFEPGTTIVITDGASSLTSLTVGEDGNWSYTPDTALSDGQHDIQVTVTDPDGVTANGIFSVTIDTTPPEGVDINNVNIIDHDGNAITHEGITAENAPNFNGTALEPGATVVIRDGETVLGESHVNEDGSWSFTPPDSLDDGKHQFTFEVIDPVGNSSGKSAVLDLSISTTKGINTGVVITDEQGNVIADGDITNHNTLTFSAQGQTPGLTVTISDGETVLGSVVVAEDGSWRFTPETALAEGSHAFVVTVTDAAGDTISDTVNVSIDTIAPELIDVDDVTVSDDAGNAFVAGGEMNDSTPTFSASGLEAGTTVIVRDNGAVLGEAEVSEDGSWSFTPSDALTEGEHSFTFEVVDAAGNSSGESATKSYLLDSVAPEGVDISQVVITDEAGEQVNPADTQSDNILTFSGGDLEPGATVTMYDKGQIVGKTTVSEDGSWSLTTSDGLYDGSHEVTFTVSDTAGNSSAPSDTLDLTVQEVVLSASDNVSSGAAIGFTYPVEVTQDLGTVLNDGGIVALNNKIVSDPIAVADGTIMDLSVTATSSSFLNVASNSTLELQKYDYSTSTWVTVTEDNSGNLFGMFGLGASTSSITLSGLTAGQYRLVYNTNGLNVGASFKLDASKIVYKLAEQGTPTHYTTAIGNVITDADSVYGSDGIPHPAYTSVTAVGVATTDGTGASVTMSASTPSATLTGQYGALEIHSDGSYVYTPVSSMDSIGKVDSFTYTITDTVTGQSSTAQLHVQIGTTNNALTLSWNATDPTAEAVTDIASSDEANASVIVTYESSTVSDADVKLVAGGTQNYSSTFTLAGSDDLTSGSLTLKTEWGVFGNNFKVPLNITYEVQMQNSDGTWTTVKTQTAVVAAGEHNSEVIQNVDVTTLLTGLGAGTYRLAVSTTGAANNVLMNVALETVSPTHYVITANEVATGNFLTDEGTDGEVDKLSSIYTRIYAKAGDNTSDVAIDDSYTWVTESGVSIAGQYGTLVLYNNGAYTYTPATDSLPAGSVDVFTYALKGANGEVVNATVTIHLGVEVNGSSGGALVFQGTEANDVFDIYDISFVSADGAAGYDTLAWHGNGQLVLSDVAAKISNIEAIMLSSTTSSDNLVLNAQSVETVSSESNTLFIKGMAGDKVTLEGTWINSGTVIVDSVTFTHYTSTTADDTVVDIFVQKGLSLSSATYQDSQDGTEYYVTTSQDITGTEKGDIFHITDNSFAHIDGGEGLDTLVWHANGTLTLSDLQAKLSNIEEIELADDNVVTNLVVSAQSVASITDDRNTLFVKGDSADQLTLSGRWTQSGSEVVNNVDYIHYVGTTAEGQTVNLYVDRHITQSNIETASEHNAADVTGDVTLLSDSVAQTTTMKTQSDSVTSESFTINSISDLQEINVSVSGASIDASNAVYVNWSLQIYNTQTLRWDTVSSNLEMVTSGSPLSVSLSGQKAGTYRIVVDTTQSGHPGFLWSTVYDELTVNISVNIVSTTDYKVTHSTSVNGSIFASDSAGESSLLVKSITAGIVSGAANYALVTDAGTTIAGTYGSLTIKTDGSYTYTLNSDSVIKLAGSEDAFTYILADGTVKNLVMTLGVSVDGAEGGALTFAGTVGDDTFTIYDTHFTSVDGKSGQDTLVWNGAGSLNLSDIADKVSNIEILDLQDNGKATTLLISADDIEKITDESHVLYVRGGSNDSLSLQGVWAVNGTETLNNITYTLYTSTALDGTAIRLYVQQDLHFNEVTEHLNGSVMDASADLTVVSVSQNGETAAITDDALSFKGAYGTLVIDDAGHYSYVVDDAYAHSGNTDTFTYTLSDGSNGSLSFNLGVDVDGSAGGAITFTGTSGADVFEVYDTDFISVNGAEGNDTLAWHGTGALNLSDISARVSNIETIDLLKDAGKDNLVVSAESVLKVTDNDNTLYVRGENGDTVTLNGNWQQADGLVANGINYNHYVSSAADGSVAQIYIEDHVTIG